MKYSKLGKVSVQWGSNQETSSYRCGLDGRMELKAVEPAVGGSYQPEWLPVLKTKESTEEEFRSRFSVGDRVKMVGTVADLKEKQEMHNRWNPNMEKVQYVYYLGHLNVSIYLLAHQIP